MRTVSQSAAWAGGWQGRKGTGFSWQREVKKNEGAPRRDSTLDFGRMFLPFV